MERLRRAVFGAMVFGALFICAEAPAAFEGVASNGKLHVHVDSVSGAISVAGEGLGRRWSQEVYDKEGKISDIKSADERNVRWIYETGGRKYQVTLELEADRPEFVVEISGYGVLEEPLDYPHPFVTEVGTRLVLAMNEGISHPVEDETVELRQQYFTEKVPFYAGHWGMSMAFWAVTDNEGRGYMAIVETPDDASARLLRIDKKLCVVPEWDATMGRFGYTRRIRYVFFGKGGHVAVCKRYREYTKKKGLFKSLKTKRGENPNIDTLVGAVNAWCWEDDAVGIVKNMKAAGIDRILWSKQQDPNVVRELNAMGGVLTSRYEDYHDLLDPNVSKNELKRTRSDWKDAMWPDDMVIGADGEHQKSWEVRTRDGRSFFCCAPCSRQMIKYTVDRVPEELKKSPETCRFLDVTTAVAWWECYSPAHPMTRTDSKRARMELLRFMSGDMKLVTGSETGIDAAVPYVDYWEGMISLARYRVDEAGRDMRRIWDEVPERVAKWQMGHRDRLPLWELVYHDCVVSQWYWGDYNNKLPALWDKRDLFNILYGTGPMFMFDKEVWEKEKGRFVQSYKNISPVLRAVGYAEMTDHRFLTADRDVQQTEFDNGVVITVNFGKEEFKLPDGTAVAPMGYHVSGI
jgi:hypothetical protein